ncbi:mucin-17 isoform X16 [Oryzias melastigma]|uniref:mucin-17 isoform X16 n=1 Tax=Oryzias melastigma TaxID=30732 RepID=UPI00168D0E72|nr:mucin-17 isoform X16 [Oryzias melastigma]
MATTKSNWTFIALLLTLFILETQNFTELTLQVPQDYLNEPGLPYRREKRDVSVQQDKAEYEVDVELNLTDSRTVEYLRNFLKNTKFILTLDPSVNITQVDLTTVCYINGTNIECKCEDQYVWPKSSCFTYGACDEVTDSTCGCINKIPSDGSSCQPKSAFVYQYRLDIQINIKDTEQLRSAFANLTFPRQIRSDVNISDADVTTICSPAGSDIQCRCENNYLWPCDRCTTYRKCDEGSACGCIQTVPTDGQFCQSELNNLTVCPSTTLVPSLEYSSTVTTKTTPDVTTTVTDSSTISTEISTTTPDVTTPRTDPLPVYEYVISVDLNTTGVTVINRFRNILENFTYPYSINGNTQINQANISTVCSPVSDGYQCRCEDQYQWSCDQCQMYGACDQISEDSCGCIKAIPSDGNFCQSVDQHNFTACPTTTILASTYFSTAATEIFTTTPDVKTTATDFSSTVPEIFTTKQDVTTTVTDPPPVYTYSISVELNITDMKAITKMRDILGTISYPYTISGNTQINQANISTVCSPVSDGYQCRCEDQYQWSCDQCQMYGACDQISADSCGCIKAIPSDGNFCQSVDQHNFTVCPLSTTSSTFSTLSPSASTEILTTMPNVNTTMTEAPPAYRYLISVELNTTALMAINTLRSFLGNIAYPFSINKQTQINRANISTVCSPVSDGYQCRCEDQYQWSCDQCQMYGACDQISENSCGCIKAIPSDGNFCQSVDQHNFTLCPTTSTPSTILSYTSLTPTELFTTLPDMTTTMTEPPPAYRYLISVELNTTALTALNTLRSILGNIVYPFSINSQTQINRANISTVCFPVSDGYQCRCENQYMWSCDQCLTYGACDQISENSCGCINSIPSDGNFCQSLDQYNFTLCPTTTPSTILTFSPSASTEILTTMPDVTTTMTEPPPAYRYLISVELNTTALTALNTLRSILGNIVYPFSINSQTQINRANISTVCSPLSDGYQCRCEDQYQWSCDQCQMYGACDQISEDSCGCIKAIPSDGNFCQSVDQHNFTLCPTTTPTTVLTYSSSTPTELFTTTADVTTLTTAEPPPLYKYFLSVELNTTDVIVINKLRSILENISYPLSINRQTRINYANISTVCSPVSDGYQCRCEDQYQWSCDQCQMYGACDQISEDSCGCIKAIPSDGNFCQSVDQNNFTLCPSAIPSTISTYYSPTPTALFTTTADVTTTMTAEPPPLYRYFLSVELNTTDVIVINKLRSVLENISYPLSINSQTRINYANISTVCSPVSDGYQCRCEDQYQWSCDQCQMYGACDQISEDSCGCIKAIPSDGNFCQSVDQHNFTVCPLTPTPSPLTTYSPPVSTEIFTTTVDVTTITASSSVTTETFTTAQDGTTAMTEPPPLYKYVLSVELNTTDVIVIDKLRRVLENISYPLSITSQTRINYANISTVCSPVSDGYQCRCEDQYKWSCDQCQMYGACDQISENSCGCIKAIPSDGNFCQSLNQNNFTVCAPTPTPDPLLTSSPSVTTEIITTVPDVTTTVTESPTVTTEILTTTVEVTTPTTDSPSVTTKVDTTTVDVTTTMTAEPPPLYKYVLSVELNTTDVIVINKLRSVLENISYPLSINSQTQINYANISTVCSPVSDGYQCRCEDQYQWSCDQCQMYGACDQISEDSCGCVKAIPSDGNFCQSLYQNNFTVCPPTPTPIPLTTYLPSVSTEIITTTVDVTTITVSPSVTTEAFTTAQQVTTTMTVSPSMTTEAFTTAQQVTTTMTDSPSVTTEIFTTVPDVTTIMTGSPSVTTKLFTTKADLTTPTTDSPVTTKLFTTRADVTTPTTELPLPVYNYRVSVELNTTEITVIDKLRSILGNITYLPSISRLIRISWANISTVCSPVSGGYQCKCEDHYHWSCDQCQMYGACDQISENSCGCVNAIPPDGDFCQPRDQLNLTACLVETTTPSTSTAWTSQSFKTTGDNSMTSVNTTETTNSSTPPIISPTTGVSTLIYTTTEDPTTASSTVTLTTRDDTTTMMSTVSPTIMETTTAVSTVISTTTEEPTTLVSTVIHTTNEQPTTPVSTVVSTPTEETTARSTVTPSTTKTQTSSVTMDFPIRTETTTKAVSKAIDIEVSVTFDMEFKDAFNDKSSAEYKSLEDKISTELQRQYETITGFVRVIVTGFRRGSVIADFVISTAEGSATQITQANKNLTNTLKSIAPVLKSTALYKSSRNITYITYTPPILTGKTMELQCGPPDGDLLAIVGNIKSAQWKADGIKILSGTRQTFTIVSNTSVLTVNNLINKDAGLYECILSGTNSDFYQNITVKRDDIKAAPLLEMTPKLSVECKTSTKVSLDCCVQSNYVASLVNPPTEVQILEPTTSNEKYCVKYEYTIPSCSSNPQPITFKCKVDGYNGYEKTTTLNFFTGAPTCTSNIYGQGQEGATSTIVCPGGTKTAQCKAGSWIVITDNCILPVIKDLLTESADLVPEKVETFSNDLKKTVKDNKTEIAKSSKSVSTIVDIVKTIANVSTFVTTEIITNVLQTIDVLTDDSVKQSWETLNKDRNDNAASRLLGSLETLSQALSGTADVSTERIHLIRTNATEFKPSNSTVSIEIQDSDGVFNNNTFMTIIILNTFNNVMPARNSSFDLNLFNGTSNETTSANNANLAINAAVVLVQVNQTVPSVNFKFIALNENLTKETQCVFWNFTLLENFGAWDDEGCKFVSRENDTVICNCSHLTSFSVLMSTDISLFVNKPPGSGSGSGGSSPGGSGGGQGATITAAGFILDIITYIGVAISLASLVICLIIEGYVWRAVTKNTTALMRHISIVNTALSLLIADICFIIAASYSQKAINNTDGDFKGLIGQCTAVTFFMHFFYLALFFWMLVSGLLLFYRTVMVFSHMSKSIMIAIGFVVGYGCPLIIAVTTVAATAPSQTYIRKNYICWLNWTESKALLSLVIPALVIVVINIIVVIVVLCKMMRRSSGNTVQPDEKNSFVVIIRCLAILTPLFGLTWALGIGTMVSPKDLGIHIAFAFFNSLQGFFILVFGTLFDSKIRALLSSRMPSTNSNSTGSTSAGTSSFGGLVSRLRGRNVYQVSQPRNSGNTNSSSESYSMI